MNNSFTDTPLNKVTLNEYKDIYVIDSKVYCEGSDANSTHPRVFLQISKLQKGFENSIKCPYCNQKFILKNNGK